jgi:phosphate transport system permease protein
MNPELKDKSGSHTGQNTNFSKSILKKQLRFSDWFAEKFIKSVAFFSIAFVILIFLFVFRETLPMFTGSNRYDKQNHKTEAGYDDSYEPTPESYIPEDLAPEIYVPGDEFQDAAVLEPETYSTDDDTHDQDVLQPERYGDIITDSNTNENSYLEDTATGGYTVSGEAENPVRTLFSRDWQPVSDKPRYGLLPLIVGTLKVTILSILFAAPVAIFAALYTAMFSPRRLKEYIKPVIELLAGFPSVVIGFFALMVLASFFQNLFGYSSRLNAFVGAIAMGLTAIPIIYTLTEDALTAVPRTYIEASLGLGASIRQTAFTVVLPAATPGIFAAVLLGIGRVFGETMIALMATGNAAIISMNPFDSVRTLSATIGAEMAEVVFGDTHYSVLFLIGSLLFIFTFTLNAVAEFYFKSRVVRHIQGK